MPRDNSILKNYLQQKASIYVVSKDLLVEFAKMTQKRKAWSFGNGEKQSVLNDKFNESNKLEHLLTQQKILNQLITSYLQYMD